MIHKILPYGANGNPFIYLLHPGREIEAEVLRGEVIACWKLIEALPYAQKYTSGVLSFSEILTPEQEREIIDSYEHTACAGRPDDFERVWIRHREHGRTELHFVFANLCLPTGKRWAHYFDAVDRKLFKAWQELTNIRYGFTSPDAPERRRLADMPGKLPAEKKALFTKLDELVCTAVARGQLRTRDDVVALLQAEGYEVNASRKYLAVKAPGSDEKALRLRGKKYGEDFTREALLASAVARTPEEEAERKRRYERDFAEAMAKRTAYVERVCRPRRVRDQEPAPVIVKPETQELEEALRQRLMDETFAPELPNHESKIQDESGAGSIVSAGLCRADEAGGGAVCAARAATWGASLAHGCERLVEAIRRRLGAPYDHRGDAGGRVGLPVVLGESLRLGQRVAARLLGYVLGGKTGGVAAPGSGDGKPAPSVGETGREHRERDRSPELPG